MLPRWIVLLLLAGAVSASAQTVHRPFSLLEASGGLGERRLACEDFDAYVNGHWYAAHPISPTAETSDAFSEAASRVQSTLETILASSLVNERRSDTARVVSDFWLAGMDRERAEQMGLRPLAVSLGEIGRIKSRSQLIALLQNADWIRFFFDTYVSADYLQPDKPLLYVEPATLGLPDRSYYVDVDKAPLREKYAAYISQLLALAANDSADHHQEASQAVLSIETSLARSRYSAEHIARNQNLNYNPVTLAIASQSSGVQWNEFLQSFGVVAPERISQVDPDFHRTLRTLVQTLPLGDWRNYLRFRLLAESAPFLSSKFQKAHFNFVEREISGRKEPMARADAVMAAMDQEIGEAVGELYVGAAFSEQSKRNAQQIASSVASALRTRVASVPWMSRATQLAAVAKAEAIQQKIGYPPTWTSWAELRTDSADMLGNLRRVRIFNLERSLRRLASPVDRARWYRSPHMINAYYRAQANEIVIPAARLQPPFFFSDADSPVNYGAIGAVIGHEMTHAFDDQGSKFDSYGRMRDWWSTQDKSSYQLLVHKLVAQYSSMEVGNGKRVNGMLTLGENIADIGGLAASLDAMHASAAETPDPMLEGFTRDQRFFISYAISRRGLYSDRVMDYVLRADSHSPPKQRINGAVRNLSAFQQAFQCPQGSALFLKPSEQINIW